MQRGRRQLGQVLARERTINLDPAVIAAPAITTAVDVSGMVIYFTVARSILSL